VRLEGKVVVVTGSGHGIGEAFAHRFTAEGARVVVTDVDTEATERVARAVGTVGHAGDITEPDTVRAVARLARETYGEIDVWYSNAGFSGPREPGEIQDDALWAQGWDLHVMAHVHAVREVVPAMLERGDGYLLQTASIVSLSAQADKASYSVTKHAALALAEWLAISYRHRGVKVSCFCPGPMLTRMLLSNDYPPDHPVMKIARTPEQVADLLVHGIDAERFLILDDDSAINGLRARADDYDAWIDRMSGAVR
jgi:NAD(P)-dependent dehydrogenase (short-subunit alcohol dehydrogenase family)